MGAEILNAAYAARAEWERLGETRRREARVTARGGGVLGWLFGVLVCYFL